MVNLSDVFIGTKQSRFAGIAIFAAIVIVCISILFTNTDISLTQRFGIVLFIILTSIPSVFLSLFELTCIVTGGNSKTHVLCHYFAWFVTFIIFIYCGLIIVSVILSMFTYNTAMDRIKENEENKKVSKDDANKIAENIMHNDNKQGEQFTSQPSQKTTQEKENYQNNTPQYQNESGNYNPINSFSSLDTEFSISPSEMKNNNMSFNASSGFDNSLSEWKPMTMQPAMQPAMQPSIKPLSNSGGNLSTTPGSVPEPYINENFALL